MKTLVRANSKTELTDNQRVKRIQKVIKRAERMLLNRFSFLKHRNIIAAGVTIFSCLGMIGMGALYLQGIVPWYVAIFVSTFLAGLLNEIEHDLIHYIYFRNNPIMQNVTLFLVWAFRGNYMSPWRRRLYHLHHHKTSGSTQDMETRFTGLGQPYGLVRILLHIDPLWGYAFIGKVTGENKTVYGEEIGMKATLKHMVPVTIPFLILWMSFLGLQTFHLVSFVSGLDVTLPSWLAAYDAFLLNAAVVFLIPCTLRAASMHILSSHAHYVGEKLHPIRQGQILDFWFLKPFQIFVFNFGVTHIMHHLVVLQPFYIRQLISGVSQKAMRKYGIPHNDYGMILRGNRHPDFSEVAA